MFVVLTKIFKSGGPNFCTKKTYNHRLELELCSNRGIIQEKSFTTLSYWRVPEIIFIFLDNLLIDVLICTLKLKTRLQYFILKNINDKML